MLERDRIAVYDLTALNTPGGLNHSTFATSPEIVELIGTRLASGQTVGESGQRFSDTMFSKATGAFSSAGDAAGLVVSAPTAAIDADARETYAAPNAPVLRRHVRQRMNPADASGVSPHLCCQRDRKGAWLFRAVTPSWRLLSGNVLDEQTDCIRPT